MKLAAFCLIAIPVVRWEVVAVGVNSDHRVLRRRDRVVDRDGLPDRLDEVDRHRRHVAVRQPSFAT
jgi:hypothetical protein